VKKTIYGKIGFRYNEQARRLNPEVINCARKIPTTVLSDVMKGMYTMSYQIHPMYPAKKMVGSALTVKVRSADNLMLQKAVNMVSPGDVVVVDMQGTMAYSACGEVMSGCMQKLGAEGLLVDGAVRDVNGIVETTMPVYAKGRICNCGDKDGPGEVNFPIVCGGIPVFPGDIIVGDENGVVVIPFDDAEDVLEMAKEKMSDGTSEPQDSSEAS